MEEATKGEPASGADWARARELFLDLADLPEGERANRLDQLLSDEPEVGAWVRRLLDQDKGASEDERGGAARSRAPERLGPYEVLGPLGEGGMGAVYVGQRADGEFERRVAIKVLHPGTANHELVQRFLRERQTLARLDHEYIAGLLDGGTGEEGEPYLVMELVEGEPADAFAQRLPQRERVELFVRICQAVQHAHERGFVHRDLKPSNILVRSDGTPKLLDFGIARIRPDALSSPSEPNQGPLTRTGMRLFTPEYASPEQVRGEEVTELSDLFSLGTLLYQFLSGTGPWPASESLHVLERSICEAEPPPPSRPAARTTLGRVSNDLDAIVLHCLAKRPADRYPSVVELIDDLQRCLAGIPIQVRRPGALERLVRAARRRPARVAIGSLILFSLTIGWIAWRTQQEIVGQGDELRAGTVEQVNARYNAADIHATEGNFKEALAELEIALSVLDKLPNEILLRVSVLSAMANYRNLVRDWQGAVVALDEIDSLTAQLDELDPLVTSNILLSRSTALNHLETGERSLAAARDALEFTQTEIPVGVRDRVDALLGWRIQLLNEGRSKEAFDAGAEAVAEARLLANPRSTALSQALNDHAIDLATAGRLEEASACYAEALSILTWLHGERHRAVALVRFNLGTTLYRLGRLEESEIELRRSLEASREGDMAVQVSNCLQFLGCIHYDRGEYAEGEVAAREALEIRERLAPRFKVERSRCLLGMLRIAQGHTDEGVALMEPIFAQSEYNIMASMEGEALHRLGEILLDRGEVPRGKTFLARALRLKRSYLGANHPDCASIVALLEAED